MKLHGAIISPNVRKAIIAFMLKGVKFEPNIIIPGPALKEPEFLSLNPLGMIPALEDGPLIIGDSNVIVQYLDDKYPQNPLLPDSPEDRAKCRWLAEYIGSALFPCCGTMFREVLVNPKYFGQPTNKEAVEETVSKKFPPVLDYLEERTPEAGFLFGESITLADISMISMFITGAYGGYSIDEKSWPKLASYMKRANAHPVLVKCLENEVPMIQMMNPDFKGLAA